MPLGQAAVPLGNIVRMSPQRPPEIPGRRVAPAWLALLVLLTLLPGCIALAAGGAAAAGAFYYEGALNIDVEADPRTAIEASRDAVEEMGLRVTTYAATDFDGHLFARTANDTGVDIQVDPRGPRASRIAIRVGVFGDEALSVAIYERIRTRLPVIETAQPAPEPEAEERSWNEKQPVAPPPR